MKLSGNILINRNLYDIIFNENIYPRQLCADLSPANYSPHSKRHLQPVLPISQEDSLIYDR